MRVSSPSRSQTKLASLSGTDRAAGEKARRGGDAESSQTASTGFEPFVLS